MPLAVHPILTILGLAERRCRGNAYADRPGAGYRTIMGFNYFAGAPPACELRLLACSIVDLK
jgi:hypothetical protein